MSLFCMNWNHLSVQQQPATVNSLWCLALTLFHVKTGLLMQRWQRFQMPPLLVNAQEELYETEDSSATHVQDKCIAGRLLIVVNGDCLPGWQALHIFQKWLNLPLYSLRLLVLIVIMCFCWVFIAANSHLTLLQL